MSYTGIYSSLKPLYNDKRTKGIKIIDLEGFEDKMENMNLSNKAIIEEEKDYSDYPYKIYKYLYGFKTYNRTDNCNEKSTSTLSCYFNLERLAIEYNTNEFINFWSEISNYTEPFWFVHPGKEHGLQSTGLDVILNDSIVYYVECRNGEIDVLEYNLGVKNIEKIQTY